MSLSGWFHGKSAPRPERTSLPQSPYLPSVDLDEDTFYSWINPAYLNPETQEKMRTMNVGFQSRGFIGVFGS